MTTVEYLEKRRIPDHRPQAGHFGLSYYSGDGSNYPKDGSYLDPESAYRNRFKDMALWIKTVMGNSGTAIDIGGGTGHLGYWMQRVAPEMKVLHTDYSFDALKFGKSIYPHEAIQLSANDLPLRPESADAVVFADVLEHLEPSMAVKAVNEAHRILKPNGHIFINIPNCATWSDNTFKEPSHIWIPSKSDMGKMLSASEFTDIKMTTRGFPWSNFVRSFSNKDMHLPFGGTSIFIHALK